jgi:hypothetical protein
MKNQIKSLTIFFILLGNLFISQTAISQPVDKSKDTKFLSCRKAKAFKNKYESLKVQLPDSEFTCDPEYDDVGDAIIGYKYKTYEEAQEQFQKDIKAGRTTYSQWETYKSPPSYNLTDDDLTWIITNAFNIKYPKLFDNLGANNKGVFFVYRNTIKYVGNDTVTFWYFQSFFRPDTTNFGYANSYKAQVAINCKRASGAYLQSIHYATTDDSGDVKGSFSTDISKARFDEIAPNTLMEQLHERYCRQSKRK